MGAGILGGRFVGHWLATTAGAMLMLSVGCLGMGGSGGGSGGSLEPRIETQPSDQSVAVGQFVTFMVRASGIGPIHYQWRHDGQPVGTDQPELTLSSASTGDAGLYWVVATNNFGSATSAQARLSLAGSASSFITPDVVQASGGTQTLGHFKNIAVAGEPVAVTISQNPTGAVVHRSGFLPPTPEP